MLYRIDKKQSKQATDVKHASFSTTLSVQGAHHVISVRSV